MTTPAVFHIALALAPGASHGYRIMSDVAALSEGQMRIGPGTLYRSLQRMEVDGLIEPVPDPDGDGDPRRRSYALTQLGRNTLAERARTMRRLVCAAIDRGVLTAEDQ